MEDAIDEVIPRDVFGFWLYILTDCILFGTLFAAFIVLNAPFHHHHMPGPSLHEYIELNYVLIETFVLLTSNFTFGLAIIAFNKGHIARAIVRLVLTFILGATFVGMELYEFYHMFTNGFSWTTNASASSFYALVGTHGLHVSVGLLWIAIMMYQLHKFRDRPVMHQRMICLGLFWNFLDVIWIFVFSIVYLMGAA